MSRQAQQNFITQLPDGSVGISFPGGITMPLGPGIGLQGGTNSVRWVRQDGTGGGYLYISDNGPGASRLAVQAGTDPNTAGLLVFQRDTPPAVGTVTVNVPPPPNPTPSLVVQSQVLLDNNGVGGPGIRSQFVFAENSRRTVVMTAVVNAAGVIQWGTGGFLVARVGVGIYNITTNYQGGPHVPVVTPIVSSGHLVAPTIASIADSPPTSVTQVQFADTGTGVPFDTWFSIILIPSGP